MRHVTVVRQVSLRSHPGHFKESAWTLKPRISSILAAVSTILAIYSKEGTCGRLVRTAVAATWSLPSRVKHLMGAASAGDKASQGPAAPSWLLMPEVEAGSSVLDAFLVQIRVPPVALERTRFHVSFRGNTE